MSRHLAPLAPAARIRPVTTLASPATTLAERYRNFLFDSMPGIRGIGYGRHHWEESVLVYTTEDDFELRVVVSLEDTHESVTEKLQLAYDRAREEMEEDREAVFSSDRGMFFHLLY